LRPERRNAAVGLAVVGLLGVFVATNMSVTTDMTHFLTSNDAQRQGRLAGALADSELSRTLILSVGAPSQQDAVRGAVALAERLAKHPETAWIERGVPTDIESAVYELYFQRRFHFLSEHPDTELAERFSPEGLDRVAAQLKEQLILPTAPLIKRLAPADPTQSFMALLARFERARPRGLRIEEDQFVTDDGKHAIIFLGTRSSPLDARAQEPFLASIDEAIAAVGRELGVSLVVERAGVHPFSVQARRSIESDIKRISIVSTVALILLFLWFFRSFRILGLAFAPIIVGLLGGLAAGLAFFGQIHGLTIAFAATLIGSSIDYPVHFFTHHALNEPGTRPTVSFSRVWPGLWLGTATSILGFGGLAASGLPGLQEVAIVAGTGLGAALACTRYILPVLTPVIQQTAPHQERIATRLTRLLQGLGQRRKLLLVVPLLAVATTIVGLFFLRWNDDIGQLNRLDPALVAEGDSVRGRVAHVEPGRLIVAFGPDEETALQTTELIEGRLEAAKSQGLLGGFRSIHPFLWSKRLQRANLEAVRTSDLGPAMSAALGRAGFRETGFQPFRDAVAAEPLAPLVWSDLKDSPLVSLIRPFRIQTSDGVGFLTFLEAVPDLAPLEAMLADVPGAMVFDQRAFVSRTFGTYRERALLVVLIGMFAVLLLVALWYRKWILILVAGAPALLACGSTAAILTFLGDELNLVHFVALLLVFSMGVDYGIFMAESRHHEAGRAATVLGLAFACGSTVLSFGLLGLSDNPALRALGLTTGIGILASLMLAPSVLLLSENRAATIGGDDVSTDT